MANYCNWGYSLHIGISNYSKFDRNGIKVSNLPRPVEDAHYYSKKMASISSSGRLKDYRYGNLILLNSDANLKNILTYILYMAQITEDGDIVTITFSGHGFTYDGANVWALYDTVFYDYCLYQLLRLFKTKVRVVIISDCCQSIGMIDQLPTKIYKRVWSNFIATIKEISEDFANKLDLLVAKGNTRMLMTNVTHLSAVSSDIKGVLDCVNFSDFMDQYLQSQGGFKHNTEEMLAEIRKIAKDFYMLNTRVFRSLGGFSDLDIPYSESSFKDREVMLELLPNIKKFGLHFPEHTNKKAFHVY